MPVTLEQVAEMAAAMPGVVVTERWGNRTWAVGKKAFAWERPYSKADVKRFGDEPIPSPPIVAVTVADLGEKEAILAAGLKGVFTIQHFDGYAAVLVELETVSKKTMRELLEDGWSAVAPPGLHPD